MNNKEQQLVTNNMSIISNSNLFKKESLYGDKSSNDFDIRNNEAREEQCTCDGSNVGMTDFCSCYFK